MIQLMSIKSNDRQSWFPLFKLGKSLMILRMFYQFNYKRSWKNWKPKKQRARSWLSTDPINNSKLAFDQSECAYHLTERGPALNTFVLICRMNRMKQHSTCLITFHTRFSQPSCWFLVRWSTHTRCSNINPYPTPG